MDSIDVKILGCLKENARQNASAIGEYVNMSVSAVIERIKKLENSGVIQQYTLLLDTKKIGKDISAFISVSLSIRNSMRGLLKTSSKIHRLQNAIILQAILIFC